MGESQRSKQATKLNQELGSFGNEIRGLNTNVQNRFDNYKLPFNYATMSKLIDEITKGNINTVNQQASGDIQQGQSDVAERLASQGIAGSSIKDSAIGKVAGDVNRNKYNLTQQLLNKGLESKLGAMDTQNRYDFAATQGAQNVDFRNIADLFQKYGLIGGTYNQKLGNIGNLDDTTFLDDILGVANTIANFLPTPKTGAEGGK